jgi:hypothetical protein
MILCAGGDIHGGLDRFFGDLLVFEAALGVRFEAVLQVGDFGVWPDPARIDRATRKHEGAGDFPAWFAAGRPAPRLTWFIKGNHEDFDWLEENRGEEVLPGLTFLPNGEVLEMRRSGSVIAVGGIGGCYGPSDYERPGRDLRGYARRHYTWDEVEGLCARGRLDILLLHDAPAGVQIVKKFGEGREHRYVSQAAGLADVVAQTHPRLCLFGHHHARLDAEVAGVRCIGLNIVGRPGNLMALELEDSGRGFRVLAEWPEQAA